MKSRPAGNIKYRVFTLTALTTLSFSLARAQSIPAPQLNQSTFSRILAQTLGSLDHCLSSRFRIDGEWNADGSLVLNDLEFHGELPFARDVNVALQPPSGNAQLDGQIPSVFGNTAGLKIRVDAVRDARGPGRLNAQIRFLRGQAGPSVPANRTAPVRPPGPAPLCPVQGTAFGGQAAEIEIDVRSQQTDYATVRISGIDIAIEGLASDAPEIKATAPCQAGQVRVRSVDDQTNQIQFRDATCNFRVTYVKGSGQTKIGFALSTIDAPAAPAPR